MYIPNQPPSDELFDRPSRSAQKRAITAIEDLTRDILELAPYELVTLQLDSGLLEEIEITKKIKAHVARRRRLRYLCRLVQEADIDAIQIAMSKLRGKSRRS